MTAAARRATMLTAAFGGWTVFEWATRIRNAAADDSLDGAAKAFAVGSAVMFTAVGLLTLVLVWRSRRTGVQPAANAFLLPFAGITTAWWTVRSTLIWFGDESTGFKVVHTVLAVISITLALLAVRAVAGVAADEDQLVVRA